MPKFRKKPVVVEAQQWWPPGDPRHKPVDGVDYRPPTIMFSLDGEFYYVTGGVPLSRQWLSVKKFPIEEAEAFKGNGLDGMEGFKHGEERYGRRSLPFSMWKVKEGEEKPVDRESDLYLDYGSAERWKDHPTGYATIETLEGRHVASPGDWIITGVKGEKYPCKPDIFEETYEPVGD